MVAGVVLPILPLGLAAGGSPVFNPWQSGQWSMMVAMLLGGPPLWVMYPLVLAAMAGMTLVVVRPRTWGHGAIVRLGVYSGIPLALQLGIVLWVTLMGSVLKGLLASVVSAGVIAVVVGLMHWQRQRVWRVMVWVNRPWKWWALAGLVAGLCVVGWQFILGGFVVTGPWWTLLAFVLLSWRVWRTPGEGGPSWWLLLLAWLGGYGIAWAGAVRLAIDAYRALPTEPSDCYICTAAMRGHAGFVGTQVVPGRDGTVRRTSRQFDRIKTFELAVQAASPSVHRSLRRVYNRLGPRLAREVGRHRLLADAAYVTLKPVEWASAVAVAMGRGPRLSRRASCGGGRRGGGSGGCARTR